MQARLLNGYLEGVIDQEAFQRKSAELKGHAAVVEESLGKLAHVDPTAAKTAIEVFDFAQQAAEKWRGSSFTARRAILDSVSSNRTLSAETLCLQRRKPFDHLAERPVLKNTGRYRT